MKLLAPYPVENEDAFVQTRLDKIMAGGTYFENNIFFHVENGKLVRIPAQQKNKKSPLPLYAKHEKCFMSLFAHKALFYLTGF